MKGGGKGEAVNNECVRKGGGREGEVRKRKGGERMCVCVCVWRHKLDQSTIGGKG